MAQPERISNRDRARYLFHRLRSARLALGPREMARIEIRLSDSPLDEDPPHEVWSFASPAGPRWLYKRQVQRLVARRLADPYPPNFNLTTRTVTHSWGADGSGWVVALLVSVAGGAAAPELRRFARRLRRLRNFGARLSGLELLASWTDNDMDGFARWRIVELYNLDQETTYDELILLQQDRLSNGRSLVRYQHDQWMYELETVDQHGLDLVVRRSKHRATLTTNDEGQDRPDPQDS